MSVSSVFLLLLIYSVGTAWAAFLPRRSWTEGTRFEFVGPILHFINPGEFGLKEVCLLVSICLEPCSTFSARDCHPCSLNCSCGQFRCGKFCRSACEVVLCHNISTLLTVICSSITLQTSRLLQLYSLHSQRHALGEHISILLPPPNLSGLLGMVLSAYFVL